MRSCSVKFRSLWVVLLFAVPLYAQTDAADAIRFADKPDPHAPDSIGLYADYFKGKKDLLHWLGLYTRVGRELVIKHHEKQAGIEYLKQATESFRKPETQAEWEAMASLHMILGYIYVYVQEDLGLARDYYETSRSIYQDTLRQNHVNLAQNVLGPLGNVYSRLRNYEKATEYLRQARAIYTDQKNWDLVAKASNDIGMIYWTKEDFIVAEKWFNAGLEIQGISPDTRILLLLNVAIAVLKQGRQKEAHILTAQAAEILNQNLAQLDSLKILSHRAYIEDNKGNIYQEERQWAEAAKHFKLYIRFLTAKSGTRYRREVAQGYLELCDLFAASGQPDSILIYAQEALRCLLPEVELPGHLDHPAFGQLYPEHSLYLAFEQKIKAWDTLARLHPEDEKLWSNCLANCDRLFVCDALLRRQYDFEESKLYRQDKSRAYFEMAIYALNQLNTSGTNADELKLRAFQYAEQSREQVLTENLFVHEALAKQKMPPEIQVQLTDLQKQRAELERKRYEYLIHGREDSPVCDSITALLFEKHMRWKSLLAAFEKDREDVPEMQGLNLSQLRGLLQPDQALLEYFLGDRSLFVFILTQEKLSVLSMARPDSLDEVIEQLRQSLLDSSYQFTRRGTVLFGQSASLLYDWLLKAPLAAIPESIQGLIIVPDDILAQLPFELLGPLQGRMDFGTFPYLIRRYTVSYACSANLLLLQHQKAGDIGELKTFAGFAPAYSGIGAGRGNSFRNYDFFSRDSLPDLPGALSEVKSISKLLNGTEYSGKEATEFQFKTRASGFMILHLAMHAFTENRDPMFSRMFFTDVPNGQGEDGELYANELYTMRLQAGLVVLSACQTGLGKWRRGEGIMNLSRAFVYTGVKATLMSLWSVSDAATSGIMVDFYTALKSGKRKDDALRTAKLNYLAKASGLDASPYYWAPFVATGEMGALFNP